MENPNKQDIETHDVLENPLKKKLPGNHIPSLKDLEEDPKRAEPRNESGYSFSKWMRGWSNSKTFRVVLLIIFVLAVVVFIFQAGMTVGFMRASFDRDWNNHYLDNFAPGIRETLGNLPETNRIPNDHGALGKIISINLPTFIIIGSDNIEKAITINQNTIIRNMRQTVQPASLVPDMNVVVIGDPNGLGQINAKFIRIIPMNQNQ